MPEETRQKAILVIPAYNEEGTIAYVVGQSALLKKNGAIHDFVVVDDGSTDRTSSIAAGLGARVVRLEKNLGKGGAFVHGALFCKQNGADVMVMADADLLEGLNGAQIAWMLDEIRVRRNHEKAVMVVHRQWEAGYPPGGLFHTDRHSGFRAIEMKGLNFMFRKDGNAWEIAANRPTREFANAGYGLEILLNGRFKPAYLSDDLGGRIITKPLARGNHIIEERQKWEMVEARNILEERAGRAAALRLQRRQSLAA